MKKNRILTLHPNGKEGVNICTQKYTTIRDAILASLDKGNPMSFKDLIQSVHKKVESDFEGSVSWYVTTVKLDLEARNAIRCVRGNGPQRISLT